MTESRPARKAVPEYRLPGRFRHRKVPTGKHAKPLLSDLAGAFGYTVIFSNFERVIGYTIL